MNHAVYDLVFCLWLQNGLEVFISFTNWLELKTLKGNFVDEALIRGPTTKVPIKVCRASKDREDSVGVAVHSFIQTCQSVMSAELVGDVEQNLITAY